MRWSSLKFGVTGMAARRTWLGYRGLSMCARSASAMDATQALSRLRPVPRMRSMRPSCCWPPQAIASSRAIPGT